MYINLQKQAVMLVRRMALTLTLAAGCCTASASVVSVSIDTSTFGVASGYIDMEFGATAGAPLATAVITNLQGFAATPDIQWDVDVVAGGYKFRNDTLNLLSHAASFGGMVSFDLSITGADDPTSSYVSAFKVAAFDGVNYLGNFAPASGALATFLWTPSPTASGSGTLLASVSDSSVTLVPEPSEWVLIAIGLAVIVLVSRHRGRAAAARVGERDDPPPRGA
jgi:hypothetical protein